MEAKCNGDKKWETWNFKNYSYSSSNCLLIRTFIFSIAKVNQTSMYSTLNNKDALVASSFYKFTDNKKRGDIIIFKLPDENRLLIKRIVGLPNEKVEINSGKIYIDGKLYEEDYLKYDSYTQSDKSFFDLKEDEYFVLGDNRKPGGSIDSRIFGPIKPANKSQGENQINFTFLLVI